jgi:hypothetical protein
MPASCFWTLPVLSKPSRPWLPRTKTSLVGVVIIMLFALSSSYTVTVSCEKVKVNVKSFYFPLSIYLYS